MPKEISRYYFLTIKPHPETSLFVERPTNKSVAFGYALRVGNAGLQCYYIILVNWNMAYVREMTKDERIDLAAVDGRS